MSTTSKQPHSSSSTGATYTVHATTSGYGAFSNVDALPQQLVSHHLSLKPQTPPKDVTAIHQGYGNDEVFTGREEARLLKVTIEIRKHAWTASEKRSLIERTHALLVRWKGKKAEKTDIVVQLTEIEDWSCVMRNGRWGMWEGGGVPPSGDAESERTLVG